MTAIGNIAKVLILVALVALNLAAIPLKREWDDRRATKAADVELDLLLEKAVNREERIQVEKDWAIKGIDLAHLRAGETLEFAGFTMIWCPPGTFLMGSPRDEEGSPDSETQHKVTLTTGFWLARTECTVGQYLGVMDLRLSRTIREVDLELPITSSIVEFEDGGEVSVTKLLQRLREAFPAPRGWNWNMPTEAQWEYACRAGSIGAYGGTGSLDDMGWHNVFGRHYGYELEPVASKLPNEWGFFDMHGNCEEIVRRSYEPYSRYPASPTVDPFYPSRTCEFNIFYPPGHSTSRVILLRGGSVASPATECRSAARRETGSQAVWRSSLNVYVGFRVALTVDENGG
jgi:formylglycine-generating enzyme